MHKVGKAKPIIKNKCAAHRQWNLLQIFDFLKAYSKLQTRFIDDKKASCLIIIIIIIIIIAHLWKTEHPLQDG